MNQFSRVEVLLVMLTYNHEDCVADTLRCLQTQNFQDYKVMVIDDSSTDGTVSQIINSIGSDSRFNLIQNKTNLGIFENHQKAAKFALENFDFKFFSFVCPDDLYDSSWLFELVNEMNNLRDINPEIVMPLVEYRSPTKNYITRNTNIDIDISDAKRTRILFNRYGIAFHGLWSRRVVERFVSIRLLPIEQMFRCEVLMIATLLQRGSLRVIQKVLYTKNVHLGTKYRYPELPNLQKSELTFVHGVILLPRFLTGLFFHRRQACLLVKVYSRYLLLRLLLESKILRSKLVFWKDASQP